MEKTPIHHIRKVTNGGVITLGYYGSLDGSRERVFKESKDKDCLKTKRWERVDNQRIFRTKSAVYVITRAWLNEPVTHIAGSK